MKIWVIGRNYPEKNNNMSGSFELGQAKMLQRKGHDVSYLCCSLHPYKRIGNGGFCMWNEENVKIFSYSTFFPPRIFPIYLIKLRNYIWRRFFEKVKGRKGLPDVIHVHYPSMLLISDVLSELQKRGSKIILTEHWTKVLTNSLDMKEKEEYRRYFRYIDACICVGYPLAEAVKDLVGDTSVPIKVIPNVLDTVFEPCNSKKTDKPFEFVAVGRLVKVKQFDKIIEAFSSIFRDKCAKLTIIGGGKESQNLYNQIKRLSMEKKIELTGSLDRKAVANKIARADCLICYSRLETFGVPVIEAWACGVPVIASNAVAVISPFDTRLGVEVNYNDIDELKKKMLYMFQNIDSYNKDYIATFAQNYFTEDEIYRQLEHVYLS